MQVEEDPARRRARQRLGFEHTFVRQQAFMSTAFARAWVASICYPQLALWATLGRQLRWLGIRFADAGALMAPTGLLPTRKRSRLGLDKGDRLVFYGEQ
jgi:hypothetical protein